MAAGVILSAMRRLSRLARGDAGCPRLSSFALLSGAVVLLVLILMADPDSADCCEAYAYDPQQAAFPQAPQELAKERGH